MRRWIVVYVVVAVVRVAPAQLLLETKIALCSLPLSSASFKIIKIAHWEYFHFRFEKIQPTPLLQIQKRRSLGNWLHTYNVVVHGVMKSLTS